MEVHFPVTHWSLIARAAGGDDAARIVAMGELLDRYLRPMKAYLMQGRRIAKDEADDLLQGFIVSKVLEQGLLGHADRSRGRFRTFLLVALSTFISDQSRYENRARRSAGGTKVELDGADLSTSAADPQAIFDAEWGREVLRDALGQMQKQCAASGRDDLWGIFVGRLLGPVFERLPIVPYDELVRRHGLTSVEQASNLLVTAKRMFQRQLRAVVSCYARDEAEIDEELAELERVLGSK